MTALTEDRAGLCARGDSVPGFLSRFSTDLHKLPQMALTSAPSWAEQQHVSSAEAQHLAPRRAGRRRRVQAIPGPHADLTSTRLRRSGCNRDAQYRDQHLRFGGWSALVSAAPAP